MLNVLWLVSVSEMHWDHTSMDVVVGLLECEEIDAFWIIVNRVSKIQDVISCHTTMNTRGLAQSFWNSWYVFIDCHPWLSPTEDLILPQHFGISCTPVWVVNKQCQRPDIHKLTGKWNQWMRVWNCIYMSFLVIHSMISWSGYQWPGFAANNQISHTRMCTLMVAIYHWDLMMIYREWHYGDPDQQWVDANMVLSMTKQI